MVTKPTIYTPEYVLKEVEDILDNLRSNGSIYLLGDVIESKPYSHQRFSEWTEKFKNDELISDTIKKIKSTLENRLNKRGLEGITNATMTIFNLKNNYGWKDSQAVEHSGGFQVTRLELPTKAEIGAPVEL